MLERPMSFRWLGVNGIEIHGQVASLAIDPFFTRPPFRRLWSGRVAPDREAILNHIHPYRYILVTHSHYDHLMDVPIIARETGAEVYGSENSFNLLLALGLPPANLHPVHVGDQLCLGEYNVEVFPAQHPKTPVDRYINGPLPEGLEPPLHLFDYRMDECFSYRIQLHGRTIIHGAHSTPAQILFTSPFSNPSQIEKLLPAIHPDLIVLIHWDNFVRPLSKPIHPMASPPRFLQKAFHMITLEDYERIVDSKIPGTKFLVPELFHLYPLT